MASVYSRFCVIAAAFLSCITLGFTSTEPYQENDIMYQYASEYDSYKMDAGYSNVSISVNLRTAAHDVDKRFVSITLDSNLVDLHWNHFDFRYDFFQILLFAC